MKNVLTPTVAVIGGGPAGLSTAARLAPAVDSVLVLEREQQAGGIPRHSDHPGYGMRDRRRFMSGPAYARKLVDEATTAGAQIMTGVMVTGWHDDDTLVATSPRGRLLIRPEVFAFATGARERPRTARGITGTRPDGVLTTGQLQNLVHGHHRKVGRRAVGRRAVGRRAVVVGAELVSWSAVMTLQEAGCRTEALISEHPVGESYSLFRGPGRLWFRTRVETSSRVVAIHGRGRVTGVEVEHLDSGERRVIECDTVVFTGDWVPDNELLRMAGVELDPASLSPVVDATMRTSKDRVFAVGNLNHPVETADVVALEGQVAADRILEHLAARPTLPTSQGKAAPVGDADAGRSTDRDPAPPTSQGKAAPVGDADAGRDPNTGPAPLTTWAGVPAVLLVAEDPIRWVSPSVWVPSHPEPARRRLVAWVDRLVSRPVVTVTQGGRQVARRRLAWPAAPGRAFRIPSSMLASVTADGGEVRISIA